MGYKKKLEFANYTLVFGDNLKLLDMFKDVVYPSFVNNNNTRYFKGTNYFFIDVTLTPIYDQSNKEIIDMILSGRLVKNTKLRREQIYRKDKGIIHDEDELETAPTSLFALTLKNHRLIYLKEVAGAPDIKTFQTTSQKFLSNQHRIFIDKQYEVRKQIEAKKVTKTQLVNEYPYPDLRITTLTDSKSLREFVDKFYLIEELTIRLLPTNNEDIDNDGFWNHLNETRSRMGSINVTTRFNNKTDGLDQEEVYRQTEINMRGIDHSGGTLSGDNETFQLAVEIDDISSDMKTATKQLYNAFINQISTGSISLGNVSRSTLSKLNSIINLFI